MSRPPRIEPDEQQIAAAHRAATGATIHTINCTIGYYRNACSMGQVHAAAIWKRGLLLLALGKITGEAEAVYDSAARSLQADLRKGGNE